MPNRAYITFIQGLEILPLNELVNFAIGCFIYEQLNQLSPKIIDNAQ